MKRRPSSVHMSAYVISENLSSLTIGERCCEHIACSEPEEHEGGTNVQTVDGGVVYRQELYIDRRFPVGDSTHNGAVGTAATTINPAVREIMWSRPSYNRRKRW